MLPNPPNSLNHNFACSLSFSAVLINKSAICSYPSLLAILAKKVYLFLAWLSPAKAVCKFFSVSVPTYMFFASSFSSTSLVSITSSASPFWWQRGQIASFPFSTSKISPQILHLYFIIIFFTTKSSIFSLFKSLLLSI